MKRILSIAFGVISLVTSACSPASMQFSEEQVAVEAAPAMNGEIGGGDSASTYPAPPGAPIISKLRMMDRDAVKSTLDQIFGPAAGASTKLLVADRVDWFGGPCDRTRTECMPRPMHIFLKNGMIPSSTTLKSVLMIRTCDRIVSNDPAIEYAAKLVQTNFTMAKAKVPTQAQLEATFDLFYPGKAPSKEVIQSLKDVVTETKNLKYPAAEAWRFIFLTLCMAPDWQVP